MIKLINYITIALIPLHLIKVPLFRNASLNILDLLLLLSVLTNLTWIIRKKYLKNFLNISLLTKIAFLFIFIGFFVSFLFNTTKINIFDNLGILKSFLFLPIFFSWTVSFLVNKSLLTIKNILLSYLSMSTFLASTGIFYFFTKELTFDGRVEIFLDSPNHLAILLSLSILLLINLINSKKYFKSPILKYFLLLLLLIHTFSTIATSSTGAFLTLIVLLFVFFVKEIRNIRYNNLQLLLLAIIFCISITLLFSQKITSSLGYTQKSPPTSTDSRIVIYEVTRQIIANDYLTGIGPGNFQEKYLSKQRYNPPFPQWAVPHPHNNFLLFLVEGGLFSLFGIIILFVSKWNTKKTPLGALIFFMLFYLLIHGIIDTTIWKNDLSVIFWLFLGILLFYPKEITISKI